MRERKIFSFNSTEDSTMWYSNRELLSSKISLLRSRLSEDGTLYDGWNFSIYSDSSDINLVWTEAKKLSLDAKIVGYKMEYTKEDFKKAEYFLLSIPIFGKEDYTDSYQTKYIEEYKCEKCGSSILRQDTELYIDKTLFKGKDIGMTSNHEIVVSQKLKEIIEEANLTGMEFANVKHKSSKIKNDFSVYQLLINNTMPNMDESTPIYYDSMGYCDFCKTHGQLLTSIPRYKKEDMKYVKDFNKTEEYFGGGLSGYHNFVITKNVYGLFEKNKIKKINTILF